MKEIKLLESLTGKKVQLKEGLYAILTDSLAGDSAFNTGQAIPINGNESLEELKTAWLAADMGDEEDVDYITGAIIIDDKVRRQCESIWDKEEGGNDSSVYRTGRQAKEHAYDKAKKIIGTIEDK